MGRAISAFGKRSGFTLLESLLVMALVLVVLGIAAPFYLSFIHRSELDIATRTVASALYYAEIRAKGSENDSAWGVSVQSDSVTLFEGTNFATRDTSKDTHFDIPRSVTPTSYEVHFEKKTGKPNASGNITLQSKSGETRNLTINEKGLVEN